MIVVTCHASVYTLVWMSLDRFLAVVHPISSISIRTQRNALLWVFITFINFLMLFFTLFFSAILVTWLIVITTAFPVFLTHGEIEYEVPGHPGEFNTACLFLADNGYNHAAFQVNIYENLWWHIWQSTVLSRVCLLSGINSRSYWISIQRNLWILKLFKVTFWLTFIILKSFQYQLHTFTATFLFSAILVPKIIIFSFSSTSKGFSSFYDVHGHPRLCQSVRTSHQRKTNYYRFVCLDSWIFFWWHFMPRAHTLWQLYWLFLIFRYRSSSHLM